MPGMPMPMLWVPVHAMSPCQAHQAMSPCTPTTPMSGFGCAHQAMSPCTPTTPTSGFGCQSPCQAHQAPPSCFHPPTNQNLLTKINELYVSLNQQAQEDSNPHLRWHEARPNPQPTKVNKSGHHLTTLLLRDLPDDYTRDMLLELLESSSCKGHYDFVYLPYDFQKKSNLGWARVNMLTHRDARCAFKSLKGFTAWKVPSQKVLSVSWSQLQGLTENLDHCRNRAVMHPDVPEQFQPLLLENGRPVSFPPPTREIQAPPKHWRIPHH